MLASKYNGIHKPNVHLVLLPTEPRIRSSSRPQHEDTFTQLWLTTASLNENSSCLPHESGGRKASARRHQKIRRVDRMHIENLKLTITKSKHYQTSNNQEYFQNRKTRVDCRARCRITKLLLIELDGMKLSLHQSCRTGRLLESRAIVFGQKSDCKLRKSRRLALTTGRQGDNRTNE